MKRTGYRRAKCCYSAARQTKRLERKRYILVNGERGAAIRQKTENEKDEVITERLHHGWGGKYVTVGRKREMTNSSSTTPAKFATKTEKPRVGREHAGPQAGGKNLEKKQQTTTKRRQKGDYYGRKRLSSVFR